MIIIEGTESDKQPPVQPVQRPVRRYGQHSTSQGSSTPHESTSQLSGLPVQPRRSLVQCQQPLFSSRLIGSKHDQKSKLSPFFDWTSKERRKGKTKKKKVPTWSHTFVCLSSTSQDTIPDSQERAQLQIAGLGEKKISMSLNADAHDICFSLCEHYPKLSGGGGFEFMRVPEGGGKMLDVIASPDSGYTVSYLKAVVHHAKIFVRPLQQDLSLDPDDHEVSQYIIDYYSHYLFLMHTYRIVLLCKKNVLLVEN